MKTIAIKPPCEKEVAENNKLNNISLKKADKEIKQLLKEANNDRKNK